MVEVKKYHLPPTDLIPNSPHPILHYPNFLKLQPTSPAPTAAITNLHALLASNGWQTQWIFRYGPTQQSHYHSQTHEAMAVLSGRATIRFGVADTGEADSDKEPGGVEVQAGAGDVFVLPAGVAHKTYGTEPKGEFALLTKGNGHTLGGKEGEEALKALGDRGGLDGFTMMGAYPVGGPEWDFMVGGEKAKGEYEAIWEVALPGRDPVLGEAEEGICGQWKKAES